MINQLISHVLSDASHMPINITPGKRQKPIKKTNTESMINMKPGKKMKGDTNKDFLLVKFS